MFGVFGMERAFLVCNRRDINVKGSIIANTSDVLMLKTQIIV
jgi:hypothetical protein